MILQALYFGNFRRTWLVGLLQE